MCVDGKGEEVEEEEAVFEIHDDSVGVVHGDDGHGKEVDDGHDGKNSDHQILEAGVEGCVSVLEEFHDVENFCKTRDVVEDVEEVDGGNSSRNNHHNTDRNTGRLDVRDFLVYVRPLPHGERFCDDNLDEENRI